MIRDIKFYQSLLKFCDKKIHFDRVNAMIECHGSLIEASNKLRTNTQRIGETINSLATKAYIASLQPKTVFNGDSVVGIIGDTHLPYEHKDYLSWIHDIFDSQGVNKIIHIGDLVDHHALSFHDSEPALKGAHGEYIDAMEHLQPWKDTFPELTLITGNHDLIPQRQIKKLGFNPDQWMRPLSHVYEFPKEWIEVEDMEIDGTIYHHGHTAMGVNGFRNDAKSRMQNTVSGHCHGNLGISYSASQHRLVWGMAVGCGIDNKTMAFAYGKHFKNKPIVGCGVVKWGSEPHVFAMDLGES